MNKRLKGKRILFIVGCVLVAAAIALLVFTWIFGQRTRVDADKALSFIQEMLPPEKPGFKDGRSNTLMSAMEVDGTDYAALLEVPAFSVTMPVRMQWNSMAVSSVPCRFSGNPYDGSLIIGGVDFPKQFDFISQMDIGDEVNVTDMSGSVFRYTVTNVLHEKNSKAETLQKGEADCKLFARSKKTGDTIVVCCSLK